MSQLSVATNLAISLYGVTKKFQNSIALNQISFDVGDGEFFALLGPSGSGKTTALRCIAGFETPTNGDITLFGRPQHEYSQKNRIIATVFQDYALFPHLSVLDNIAFADMIRGVDKPTRYKQAGQYLEMVRLNGHGGKRPNQLSGGQRQRVALARALAAQPKILLLDEPLGALDYNLREQMQWELKEIQRQLKISFIFVTHDQHEAMSMADRIAIFNQGSLAQVGTPQEIYNQPKNEFTAKFMGGANIIPAEMAQKLGLPALKHALRAEFITPNGAMPAKILARQYLGGNEKLHIAIDDLHITMLCPSGMVGQVDELMVNLPREKMVPLYA